MLVALVAPEIHSDSADAWLQRQGGEALAISGWVMTEVASALAGKRRRGLLTEGHWRKAVQMAGKLATTAFVSLPVEAAHFAAAGERMIQAGARGLRAGDALHLAIAAQHRAGLASLDRDLVDAAASVGLPVARIIAEA